MTEHAPNLATRYLGLDLAGPILVGSCGLTGTVEGVRSCAAAGAGAVVLKSLFEEQITAEVGQVMAAGAQENWHAEAAEYISGYGQENAVGEYLRLIENAKKTVKIPVIPSIHCVTAQQWPSFARRMEAAGADAIELNVFVLPTDPRRSGAANEKIYFDVLAAVKKQVKIPVALKISFFFSSLGETFGKLAHRGADALVLFNRFYQPDIDIERLSLTAAPFFSTPAEMYLSLRTIAQLSGRVNCDLAATTGVHDGAGVVKQLLAGATVVQVASCLYRHGVEHLEQMHADIRDWMQRKSIADLAAVRGLMSQHSWTDPVAFDRVQFMKHTAGLE